MLAGKDWKDFQSCFRIFHQAVRAISKMRPKPPILDIPFCRIGLRAHQSPLGLVRWGFHTLGQEGQHARAHFL
jgi:hypothetical protein